MMIHYCTANFKHGFKISFSCYDTCIFIHYMTMRTRSFITESPRVNHAGNHIMCYKTDWSENALSILLLVWHTFLLDWPHHLPPKSSLAGSGGVSHKLFNSRWICCNGSGRNAPAIKLIVVRHIICHSCSRIHGRFARRSVRNSFFHLMFKSRCKWHVFLIVTLQTWCIHARCQATKLLVQVQQLGFM